MPTIRRFADASIRHQVFLQRYANGVASRMLPLLRQQERKIREKLSVLKVDSVATRQRLNALQAELNILQKSIKGKFDSALTEEFSAYAKTEGRIVGNLLNGNVPGVTFDTLGVNQSLSVLDLNIAMGDIGGAQYGEWVKGMFDTQSVKMRRILNRIAGDTLTGDGIAEISRGLAKTYKISQQTATTIARTFIVQASADLHKQTYDANRDVVAGIEYNATLDRRTCVICAPDDGKKYYYNPKGNQRSIADLPSITRHANCRCVYLPIVKGFDSDGGTTYSEWFGRQKEGTQKEILGPARFELFKEDKATLGDFAVGNSVLSLEQLESRL